MQKRVHVFVFVVGIFIALSFMSIASAATDSTVLDEVITEHPDEIITDGGLKPGDFFYFADEFFNQFQNEISVKEEYMAEIFELLEEGEFERAKESFSKYQEYAARIEKEVSPEDREAARKSSAAIINELNELEKREGTFDDSDIEALFDTVREEEADIVTSAELASKIQELCKELHDTGNYDLFYKTCKTDEDSPQWQQDLYEEFTDEQVDEAKDFIKTLSFCFENAADCPCEDFTNKEFSAMCSEIAPLAAACDAGDEQACSDERLIDFDPSDILPPHLLAALEGFEEQFEDEHYEDYFPSECEGLDDRYDCENKIFSIDAPKECVEAFKKEGYKIGEDLSTGEAHEFCNKVLYELYTPEECQKENLDDDECRERMFRKDAPKECIEAGLTGKYEDDHEKCNDIMEHAYPVDDHYAYELGAECQFIEDAEERLSCYDAALGHGEFDFDKYYKDKTYHEEEYYDEDYYDDAYYEDKYKDEGGYYDEAGNYYEWEEGYEEEYYNDEYYDDDYEGEYEEEYEEEREDEYYEDEEEYTDDYRDEDREEDYEESDDDSYQEYDEDGNPITGSVISEGIRYNDIYYANPYLRYFYGLIRG